MENTENIRLPWPDWKIVKCLGSGAYGKVFQIERDIAGVREKAALKIISRPKDAAEIESYYDNGYDKASITASYESEIQNYIKEYQLMREMQGQSNIVSCDDFTIVPHANGIGADVFIRMELLTSLQQVLRERRLSEKEIIKLGKDISRALILCESKHIVHRDIKPANIMISQFGDYKLGDFGVSKVMDHKTYATAMGTPEYQAPEVVHMEKYGQTADIYSLGITLYWLLNNRKMPFIGADEMLTPMRKAEATERRYRGEKLPAPQNGSAALKQIVLKACEYRPENRYPSAKALYEALDALETQGTSGGAARRERRNEPENSRDIHTSLFVDTNEIGSRKTVRVAYPDGSEKKFDVQIPETIKTGQTLKLRGCGISRAGIPTGDLYLNVVVNQDSVQGMNDAKTEGNSWGDSFATVGNPGGNAKNRQWAAGSNPSAASAEEQFEKLFGAQAEATVGRKAPVQQQKKKQEEKRNKEEDSVKSILAKISVEKETGINVTIEILWALILWYILFISLQMGQWFAGVASVIWSIYQFTHLGSRDFKKWMKKNKASVPNIDDLIKNNSEFAEQLYYEKCPKKHLLNYIQERNPVVANEIKAARNR